MIGLRTSPQTPIEKRDELTRIDAEADVIEARPDGKPTEGYQDLNAEQKRDFDARHPEVTGKIRQRGEYSARVDDLLARNIESDIQPAVDQWLQDGNTGLLLATIDGTNNFLAKSSGEIAREIGIAAESDLESTNVLDRATAQYYNIFIETCGVNDRACVSRELDRLEDFVWPALELENGWDPGSIQEWVNDNTGRTRGRLAAAHPVVRKLFDFRTELEETGYFDTREVAFSELRENPQVQALFEQISEDTGMPMEFQRYEEYVDFRISERADSLGADPAIFGNRGSNIFLQSDPIIRLIEAASQARREALSANNPRLEALLVLLGLKATPRRSLLIAANEELETLRQEVRDAADPPDEQPTTTRVGNAGRPIDPDTPQILQMVRDGVSQSEIGRQLGLSRQAVRNRIARARTRGELEPVT